MNKHRFKKGDLVSLIWENPNRVGTIDHVGETIARVRWPDIGLKAEFVKNFRKHEMPE